MASVNKAIIVGNLGADPELRSMPSGEAVCNLRLATTDKWTDKSGQKQESTEWHRIVFFGRQAEICGQYLRKGSQIYVEGSIRTKKYTDKDGQEKYSTEIKGDRMQMLGGGREGGSGNAQEERPQQRQGTKPAAPNDGGFGTGFDDDIPF